MIKLHAQLEQALKCRINSNKEIIPAIKNLMQLGKLDKPKEIAMFAIILDRLGEIEDQALVEETLKENNINEMVGGDGLDGIGNEETLLNLPKENVNGTIGDTKLTFSESTQTESQSESEANPSNVETMSETPTVSTFTPDNITDPQSTPAS